jgi:copper oxidase (laccase) domain-containing protein
MRLEIELDNISTELKNTLINAIGDRFYEVNNNFVKVEKEGIADMAELLDCPHAAEKTAAKKLVDLKKENASLLTEYNELRKAIVTINIHSTFDEKRVLGHKRQWEEERYEKEGA